MNTAAITAQARIDTPLGPVTLAATDAGLAGLWFDGQKHHPGPLEAPTDAAQRWIQEAARELGRYWGEPTRPFHVALDPQGTAFQQAVWQALRRLRPGQTASYGEIAAKIGRASAVRAVAAAIGRNPISILVPCHRVVGRDGSLTGYAGGIDRKAALLRHEAVRPLQQHATVPAAA